MKNIIGTVLLTVFAVSGAVAQKNLSQTGTANCYIVTEAGEYSFALTKGNGAELTGVDFVDWYWQTEKDLISDVKLVESKICFNASAKRGNAVIIATDQKGTILWSWHIWATDDPTQNLHSAGNPRYMLMDRNLGAISTEIDNAESYGLYYQWGRKDPFIGTRDAGNTTLDRREEQAFSTATGKVLQNQRRARFRSVANNSIQGDVIYFAVENPTVFIGYLEQVGDSGENTWFNSSYALYDDLWGYEKRTQESTKTIYDPCPAGYKVPANSIEAWSQLENALPNGKLNGYLYMYDGEKVTYPASGNRRQTNGRMQYTGYNTFLWSASMHGENGRGLRIEAGKIHNNMKAPRAMGMPIRCVKEY